MSGIIPRDGVLEIVGHRDRALELYRIAFEQIEEAAATLAMAEEAVRTACGGALAHAYVEPHVEEVAAFENAVKLPDGEQYARVAKRLTDIKVWGSLIERTDMAHLMDKQLKDELRTQMAYVPEKVDRETGQVINADEIAQGLPEISVDAIESTIHGLVGDAGTIFRRGIANAFSKLDRRFRSHDGFKVGSRVILTNVFDDWGSWNYYRNEKDTLTDIERVFLVLDGKRPRASYAGIVGAVEEERRRGSGKRQSEIEGDYFRVRIFKNGNAHLWFKRPELVKKVNALLADHYSMGTGKEVDEDPTEEASTRAVRVHGEGWFPTPEAAARQVVESVSFWHGDDAPLRCLEPSAGLGAIARLMVEDGGQVDVIELDRDRANALEAEGIYRTVRRADFLKVRATPTYDRIVMNPPFGRSGRDIDHVLHAWDFLKPGGTLVAIMSAGTEFREDKKTTAFRKLMDQHRATYRDLPQGAFAESGTNVNTLFLRVTKKG